MSDSRWQGKVVLKPIVASLGSILLILCTSVQAEDLSSLLARLENLKGSEPLQAVVAVEKESTEKDKLSQSEKARFEITVDSNGLSLRMNPDASHANLLRTLSLYRIQELTNYASSLVDELKDLELIKTTSDTYADVACQRWQFRYEKKESQLGAKGAVSRYVDLWIDHDGYPIAAMFKNVTDIKMFFWKQHNESTRPQRYQRYGDRLVLIEDMQTTSIQHGKEIKHDIVKTRLKIMGK